MENKKNKNKFEIVSCIIQTLNGTVIFETFYFYFFFLEFLTSSEWYETW